MNKLDGDHLSHSIEFHRDYLLSKQKVKRSVQLNYTS